MRHGKEVGRISPLSDVRGSVQGTRLRAEPQISPLSTFAARYRARAVRERFLLRVPVALALFGVHGATALRNGAADVLELHGGVADPEAAGKHVL
jgi:hypothetical protein